MSHSLSHQTSNEDQPSILPEYDSFPPELDGADLPGSFEALRTWAVALTARDDNSDLATEVIPDFVTRAMELLTDVHNQLTAQRVAGEIWRHLSISVGCKICYTTPPKSPVVTGCGHVFCARCLRQELDEQVKVVVKSLDIVGRYAGGSAITSLIYAMLPFETYAQMQRLERALLALGIVLRHPLATYTCPDTTCRKVLSTAPQYLKVLEEVCRRLSNDSKLDDLESPLQQFRGLFPI